MNDGCYELFLASFTFEVQFVSRSEYFLSLLFIVYSFTFTVCAILLFSAVSFVLVMLVCIYFQSIRHHVDVTSLCSTFASFVFQLGIYHVFYVID